MNRLPPSAFVRHARRTLHRFTVVALTLLSSAAAAAPLPTTSALDAEIARGNGRLAQVSQVRRFHLLTKELDHDDGEVTATMKVRRSSVYKRYAEEIEALYRG